MKDERILSIIPAVGWRVVWNWTEALLDVEPIVAFALIEDSRGNRCVEALDCCDGEVGIARDNDAFVRLLGPEQKLSSEDYEAAKRRMSARAKIL